MIVGAGSAGCLLANRLSLAGRTLLIEAGGPDRAFEVRIPAAFSKLFKTAADWDLSSGPEPGALDRHLYVPRGKMLGGSSSLNAMIYIRGRPDDYDGWARDGADGWEWSEVFGDFLGMEDNTRGRGPWHGQGGDLRVEDLVSPSSYTRRFIDAGIEMGMPANSDFNGPTQEGIGLFQVTQRNGRRWSSADAFLRPALSRPTLTVMTGSLVDRVITKRNRAVAVEIVAGTRRATVGAGHIVLGAGTFGSPNILERSGIGDPATLRLAGLDVRHELPAVGENLQDHPTAMVVHRSLHGGTLDSAETTPNLIKFVATRSGPLTSNVGEAGAFVSHRDPLPDLQFHFGPAYFVNHGLDDFDGAAFTAGPQVLHPEARGSVHVRSASPLDPPLIVGNHLTSASDLGLLVDGIELTREIFRQPAFDDVRGPELFPGPGIATRRQLEHYARARLELLYHPVGTCRMGGDNAVVDPKLQVRGVEGLYVADASVMPTIPSGNTNAPTLMIAERAARFLTG